MTNFREMTARDFLAQPDAEAQYWVLHKAWEAEKDMLACAKAAEAQYRTLLCQLTFNAPVEGINHHSFGVFKNAAKMTLTQPVNRSIDETAIQACLADLREFIGNKIDDIVVYKPTLVVAAYKALTPDQQALLAPAITASFGMPQLKFTPAKL